MQKLFTFLLLLSIAACAAPKVATDTTSKPNEWAQKTAQATRHHGYVPYYWSAKTGKVFLEINKLDQEILYVNYLSAGIGSNDIGLDRGQIGNSRIITFKRVGNKVFMFQPNYDYRAQTDNPMEGKSVADAFARSIIAAFTIEAEKPDALLVDATDFLLRDAHGVETSLRRNRQGNYKLDKSRSAFNQDGSRNFPLNTELDAWLTFAGEAEGRNIRSVTPDANSVTVRQHHSFVQLPEAGYQSRAYDIRSGYFARSYKDYGVPIDQSIDQRYITRHRLEKKNPNAAKSEAIKPIVYFLDPGTPEPVRSALLDGARWWNQAFEAAGFVDAFQVKMLPDSVDPLDIRYNVIQWVHRSSRGWSYGASVTDPRTGEIIKGHVSLGSLRVRHDFLIATGLLAPYKNHDADPRMLDMALARLRQLSAHEIGHTLGLAHNYVSSLKDRASVMDYPHPKIDLDENGQITLRDAYAIGMGDWDKVAIQYGYQQFSDSETEKRELNTLLEKAYDQGLKYITDYDARSTGGAHPDAHLWDGHRQPTEELQHLMKIRSLALKQFGESVIRTGEPLSTLHEALVPVYFLHRYQSEAVAKLIGGAYYDYKVKGDNQQNVSIVSASLQLNALNALLETLKPNQLTLSENTLALLSPRPSGYYDRRELVNGQTDPIFDAAAMGKHYASTTLALILHPARANRLVEFHSRNNQNPSFMSVLTLIEKNLFTTPTATAYEEVMQLTTQQLYVHELIRLIQSTESSLLVRAQATQYLSELQNRLQQQAGKLAFNVKANYLSIARDIRFFMENPIEYTTPPRSEMPPGSPIGLEEFACDGMH